jgi:hypothetical protein
MFGPWASPVTENSNKKTKLSRLTKNLAERVFGKLDGVTLEFPRKGTNALIAIVRTPWLGRL